jgi:hypothetical protein
MAAILRDQSTRGQRWTEDKAFNLRLQQKKERGFTDMQDYLAKCEVYGEGLARKRKGTATEGERKSSKLAFIGFFKRLSPVFGMIAVIIAIPMLINYWNAQNTGPNYFKVQPTKTPTHTPAQATIAARVAPQETAEALTVIATRTAYAVAHPETTPAPVAQVDSTTLATAGAVCGVVIWLVIWGVRGYAKRKRAQQVKLKASAIAALQSIPPSQVLSTTGPTGEITPDTQPENVTPDKTS